VTSMVGWMASSESTLCTAGFIECPDRLGVRLGVDDDGGDGGCDVGSGGGGWNSTPTSLKSAKQIPK
jgi:hypothetical protein